MVPNLFTVVGTVFGREYFVPHLIECVLRQTYTNWELLLMADGPHLETRRMVTELLNSKPELRDKIRYFEYLPKPGVFGNLLRHKGLMQAKGEFICFIPHDCLLWPEYLEVHARAMCSGMHMSVAHAGYWHSWSDNYHPSQARQKDPVSRFCGEMPHAAVDKLQVSQIDLTCMAFPTEAARRCGVFAPDIADRYEADYLSFDRVRQVCPITESTRILASHF